MAAKVHNTLFDAGGNCYSEIRNCQEDGVPGGRAASPPMVKLKHMKNMHVRRFLRKISPVHQLLWVCLFDQLHDMAPN